MSKNKNNSGASYIDCGGQSYKRPSVDVPIRVNFSCILIT